MFTTTLITASLLTVFALAGFLGSGLHVELLSFLWDSGTLGLRGGLGMLGASVLGAVILLRLSNRGSH